MKTINLEIRPLLEGLSCNKENEVRTRKSIFLCLNLCNCLEVLYELLLVVNFPAKLLDLIHKRLVLAGELLVALFDVCVVLLIIVGQLRAPLL